MDWGLTLGAGIEHKAMQYGFVYSWGYRNITNYEPPYSKRYNAAFQLSVGYKFNLKKTKS